MRRVPQDDGNLDLLLDTICNMFGGITLIAILLAVISARLPQEQEKNVPEVDDVKPVVVDDSARIRERETLTDALRQEIHRLEQPLGDNVLLDLKSINEAIQKLESNVQVANSEGALLENEIKRLQNEMMKVVQNTEHLDRQLAEAKAEASKTKEISESRQIRLPRLRDAGGKSPVFMAIREGKLYTVNNLTPYRGTSTERGFNREQTMVSSEPNGLVIIELNRTAGQVVNEDFETTSISGQLKANVSRQQEFIYLLVYPDSFRESVVFITYLLNNNYHYFWNYISQNEPIELVPASEPHKVQ